MRGKPSTVVLCAAFMAWAPAALCQTPGPTGPAAPATDWAAVEQAYKAQAAAAQAAEAAAKAKTAQYEAENAAAKASVGTVTGQTNVTGAVTLNPDAGKAEALLLVTRASKKAADLIRAELHWGKDPMAGKDILLVSSMDELSTSDAMLFNVQEKQLTAAMTRARGLYEEAVKQDIVIKAGKGGQDSGGERSLTQVGATVDALAKLGSYFQNDYAFGGVGVTAPTDLMLYALAEAYQDVPGGPRFLRPSSQTAFNLDGILTRVGTLQALADGIAAAQEVAKARAIELHKADDDRAGPAARRYELFDASATKALAAYATFANTLVAVEAGKSPLVVRIASQTALHARLTDPNQLVLLLSEKQVGAYYSKKGLWTFLGGPPLYTMGGTAVAYSLFEPATGRMVRAGAVATHGGYQSVRRVEHLFK